MRQRRGGRRRGLGQARPRPPGRNLRRRDAERASTAGP